MKDITNHDILQTVVEELALRLPTETIRAMKALGEDDLCLFHLSLGTWLMSNLLLPDTELFRFFVENGIEHADDMSSIVIRELWRRYSGVPGCHALLDEKLIEN